MFDLYVLSISYLGIHVVVYYLYDWVFILCFILLVQLVNECTRILFYKVCFKKPWLMNPGGIGYPNPGDMIG